MGSMGNKTGVSIVEYKLQFDDERIYNPYLLDVMRIVERLQAENHEDVSHRLLEHRTALVSKYSFSIPTCESLRCIAAHSPLVEIGAGTGYWAMCLASIG
ncbi:MAG: hypothetical protein N2316_13540, partial [Spirochaetes bacterium]|nr:hypothetical protein [Spirochaetota bacterium]